MFNIIVFRELNRVIKLVGITLCLVSISCVSAELDLLLVDKPLSGELITKEVKEKQNHLSNIRISVPCRAGDYLAGYMESNEKVTIDVINNEGKSRHRLVDRKSGKTSFNLVAENCNETFLLSGIGFYKIMLEKKVSVKDQIASYKNEFLSPKISSLNKVLKRGGTTDTFWLEIEKIGTPLIEETENGVVMTFLVRGKYNNVKVIGAPSNDHELLNNLSHSDTWYKSFIVPKSTHLSYQIAPGVPELPFQGFARRVAIKAVAQVDPYNHYPWPKSAKDKYATRSTISLENSPERPELPPINSEIKGETSSFSFTSKTLGNTREITIYSSNVEEQKQAPILLYIFDARKYLELVKLPTILDTLIAEGKIPPITVVFISNPDATARSLELPANDTFADVLANELVPEVHQRLNFKPIPERTIIAGSSYGGLAATTIALRHPKIFGNVISMSGSFWWYPKEKGKNNSHFIASHVINNPKNAVRFFLSAGIYENSRKIGDGILENNRHLRDVLRAKGYETYYQEYTTGHDYFAWRGILVDGLIKLFPVESMK